jgi:hypothetical protein
MSPTATLLSKIVVHLDTFQRAHSWRNELVTGPLTMRNPHTSELDVDHVEDLRARTRQLHQEGVLYSDDYPLRYGEELGQDGSVSKITGIATATT